MFSHVTYLYQYGLIGIYFILWVTIHYCIIYFVAKIAPALAIGSYSVGSYLHLTCPHYFRFVWWSTFLLYRTTRYLSSSCFSLRINHFPRKAWFFLFYWRKVLETKIWVLSVLVATGVSPFGSSQLIEQGNMYILKYMYILVICIYIKWSVVCIY